jgi:hypothetical protein
VLLALLLSGGGARSTAPPDERRDHKRDQDEREQQEAEPGHPTGGVLRAVLCLLGRRNAAGEQKRYVEAEKRSDEAIDTASPIPSKPPSELTHRRGVAVPLYALAILKTSAIPKWIGWLGVVVAAFAGWLGLLSPLSSVIDGLTFIGFIAFFVFMAAMGIALLRRRPHELR